MVDSTVWLAAHKVRTLLALQHEVYETPDRTLGRQRLLAGLSQLVAARIGVFTIVHDFRPGGDCVMSETWDYGFDGPEHRDRLLAAYYVAAKDPGLALLAQMKEPPATARRADLMRDQAWYQNDFVHQVRIGNGLDDVIYGNRRVGAAGPHIGIGMNRAHRDGNFSEEDRELVDLIATQSLWLFGRDQYDPQGDWKHLSRRERETLDALLSGLSEKEVAERLGISAHTVHTYVKSLYKRFEVRTRAELLARLVKR